MIDPRLTDDLDQYPRLPGVPMCLAIVAGAVLAGAAVVAVVGSLLWRLS
jgi:hypothetical protein